MELLERGEFFDELEAILEAVAAGSGRIALVSGEAGIGKTTLVEGFAERHNATARLLWGACDALFTPRPLGPLYDIAPQTQGELLALLEQQAARPSIFSAVVDELQKTEVPSITVIEDVHWADEATLDLLKFLGRRISRIKSMLIITYRDDEVGPDHPLRLVLGDLPHRSVARLRLPPLSEASVNTLAQRAGRRIEGLYEVTGGNPFFVTEALASKGADIPSTVRDAVLSRAARLSPASRALLELVSVVPARTQMWLLTHTLNPDAALLEECVSSGILRYETDAIAFRHELARRSIADSLSVHRRQSLHAVVLRALVNRSSDAMLARIVHHAAQAGDGAAVLRYAPVAARQAAALSAHRESASHYQIALQYAGGLVLEERASCLNTVRMNASSPIKLRMRCRPVGRRSKSGSSWAIIPGKATTSDGYHGSIGFSAAEWRRKLLAMKPSKFLRSCPQARNWPWLIAIERSYICSQTRGRRRCYGARAQLSWPDVLARLKYSFTR
jgi:hypothetical protein